MRQASRERSGARIAEQLRERRAEIEEAILTRVYAVSEPPDTGGSEYTEGLNAAVSAALDYGIEGIERDQRSDPTLPDALLSQARLAARSGVSLDTVLRRYFAGYTLLEDFVVEEAERGELSPVALKRLLRSQATIVDRLLVAVSDAYTKEAERKPTSTKKRKAERVERLLAGEFIDTSEFVYDLEGHHLGVVASGPGAREAVETLAKQLDARLLAVPREEGILWAWLGSRRRLDPEELEAALDDPSADLTLAIGEPAQGLAGWRFTHRQARAALAVAERRGKGVVRYGDVALLAAVLRDDLLAASLRRLYLKPLEKGRDRGEAARETLRAYFAAGRNVSAAAASLSVSRQTVGSRLGAIEERIGRPLDGCSAELEAALQLCQTDEFKTAALSD